MKGITKQYIFHCSEYWNYCLNCQFCSVSAMNVVADSEEEAIAKFKRGGGKITENGEIIMPETFCELAQLSDDITYDE